MRFLIDECLHPSLVTVANGAGYEAHHIVFLGLASTKDRDLMPRIRADVFVFVTNNAVDFLRLYARESLHAGLVIIVPQVRPALQRALFAAVLARIVDAPEIINKVVEANLDVGEVVIDHYDWPPTAPAPR